MNLQTRVDKLERQAGGERFAACTCKAGERGQKCYHVAAAVGAHLPQKWHYRNYYP